jgi:hypothetical protein
VNVLTFSIVVSGIFIGLFWFLNDVLPQILFQRKLDKVARQAEECRQKYEAARAGETTMEFKIPDYYDTAGRTKSILQEAGWVE